jgi:sec-independent protein translocase protein TatB
MLRTFGRTTAKLRSMAGDFQKQFNEALKEAELDDVKKSVDTLRSMNPANEIKKSLNPFEKAANDVRAGLQSLQNPPKPAEPAASTPAAAEPLKNGATAMPGAEPVAPIAAPAAESAQPAAQSASAVNGAAVGAASANGSAAPAAAPKAPGRAAEPKASARKAAASAPAEKKTKPAAATKASAPAGAKALAKSRKTAGSAT